MITRFIAALLIAVVAASGAARAQPITVKDILGREVKLQSPARRIVLAEGRQIVALSLLDRDPVGLVAGWLGDFRRNDPGTYVLYKDRFPAVEGIPVIGAGNDGALSVEKIMALQPDLVVFGLGVVPTGGNSEVVQQLGAAGIPVAFTDFFVDPFERTLPSMRILGALTGHNEQAEAFVAFYQQHMDAIAKRLAGNSKPKPKVLIEAHAGMAGCCFSPGKGNINRYIDFAGGHNIGADILPGPSGQLSLEYVIAQNPEVYVATGGAHLARSNGLVIGPGYAAAAIKARLSEMAHRPGLADIKAVKDGRVFGLYHNLMASPLNILTTEVLAKWINPDLFADLDVARTEAEINDRFLAVPLKGIYWASLP